MYTQCPVCKTVFRLHPDHIDAAQGQVRCSRCHTIFNALANLFEQNGTTALPKEPSQPTGKTPSSPVSKAPPKGVSNKAKESSATSAETAEAVGEPITEMPQTPTRKSVSEAPAAPAEEVKEEESLLHEAMAVQPVEEKPDLTEEVTTSAQKARKETHLESALEQDSEQVTTEKLPDTTLRPDEKQAATSEARVPPPLPAEAPPRPTGEIDKSGGISAKSTPLRKKKPIRQPQPDIAPDEPLDAMPSSEAFDEQLLSLFDEGKPEKDEYQEAVPRPTAAQPTARQGALRFDEEPHSVAEQPASGTAPSHNKVQHRAKRQGEASSRAPAPQQDVECIEPDDHSESALPEEHALAERGGSANITHAKAEPVPEATGETSGGEATRPGYSIPLEQEKPHGSPLGTLLWSAGIVVMLAGLGVQYAYYNRMALAEEARLRPLLKQMCELTGCRLPPRRDLAKIELGNHLVQYHPRYEHSLLITATLVNRADFNQPFPIVEMLMTDLEQRIVARRRFRPEEYLVGNNAARGMPPGVEVPLMLEVLDPGKNAVGFEFNFF